MVPIAVILGVAAIVGLVGYLIWQQGKPAGSSFEGAAAIELDPAPDLPGEYVNLPELYKDERGLAHYGASSSEGPNTATHVTGDVDYAAAGNSNPPVGGPHWGAGTCGPDPETSPGNCGPAPWGIYRAPWDAETLVHNLEHGGAVIWYNTTDQSVIDDLENYVKDVKGPVVLTPYPDMEPEMVALTTWGRIDKFPVSEYTTDRVDQFIDANNCRFNPEDLPSC